MLVVVPEVGVDAFVGVVALKVAVGIGVADVALLSYLDPHLVKLLPLRVRRRN